MQSGAINEEELSYYISDFPREFKRDNIKEKYKDIVNDINTGINKFRNVSPSFVVSLSLFVDMLKDLGITKIMAPDYLFGRYRKKHSF